jgi:putative endonuclease
MTLAKEVGTHFENQALTYLNSQGLKPVCQNFNCKLGELDLVMLENETLIFIEVRYRTQIGYGSATESITPAKQKKIRRTAQYFLLTHPEFQHHSCRIDVIAIDKDQINWIKNAFY